MKNHGPRVTRAIRFSTAALLPTAGEVVDDDLFLRGANVDPVSLTRSR